MKYIQKRLKTLFGIGKYHLKGLLGKRLGTLVYVGLHRGTEFSAIFEKYNRCIGIEANPELAQFCKDRFKWYGSHVQIIHAAATTHFGTVDLILSNQDGGASSLGNLSPDFQNSDLRQDRTVNVPAIFLPDFLDSLGIKEIDEYISDIQGMDYTVLATLTDWIHQRRIKRIMCETTKDGRKNIYHDLPSNEFSKFKDLLNTNYELSGTGWGLVVDGQFDEVPPNWWEFDCRWKLKDELK